MNPLAAAFLNAVATAGTLLLEKEAPELKVLGGGVCSLAEKAGEILIDSTLTLAEKEALWSEEKDIVIAAKDKAEGMIPDAVSTLVNDIAELGFEVLTGSL